MRAAGWQVSRVVGNRYLLERRLGGGAMGQVFLARDRLLKKHVALKVLRTDLAENKETVRRFLREVALAHSVTHPHVVRIYDTGVAEGLPYFSMELLAGQPLDELIETEEEDDSDAAARLSIREIREIGLDVLDGMETAHQAGVVHRDLKPANVMLTHRGAIVMDFGVAGIDVSPDPVTVPNSTEEIKSIVRTDAGTVFGSPAYMAPELWEGSPATVQTDLYAFGAMLYQMLTGRLPYNARTPAEFLQKLQTTRPIPVRTLRRETPWTMALLVKRCMALDPDERPPSAAAAAALISPLRSRLRRRAAIAAVATLAIVGAVAVLRSPTTWPKYGLPDEVAVADLGAAIRAWDVGDHASVGRHLDRLALSSPKSASVAFWRATVAHELGDLRGRKAACDGAPWDGSETWIQLASAACGPSYHLAEPLLATIDRSTLALGPEFLPLAVTESLVPRVEVAGATHPVRAEARGVLKRLEKPPTWKPPFTVPTRWQLARVHLELASGRTVEAKELLAALVEESEGAPIVLQTAAWLELHTGNLEKAESFAAQLMPDHPGPSIRLLLESGKLDEAWQRILDLNHVPERHELRTMWCGYAFRFELVEPPPRCLTLPPGLVRMLWRASPSEALDRANMTPLEQTIVRRQRELDLGDCQQDGRPGPVVSHASPPFETYLPQLELSAAMCASDPTQSDFKRARMLAENIVAAAPNDPWAILLQAGVDDAVGATELARAKRRQVAERWREADAGIPLVTRLRSLVGPLEGEASAEPPDEGDDLARPKRSPPKKKKRKRP
jgi:tRNA A-37 threonylcarbamoyl transferase component Bud32